MWVVIAKSRKNKTNYFVYYFLTVFFLFAAFSFVNAGATLNC